MRTAVRNRLVQLGMLATLAWAGWPLVSPLLPSTPQAIPLADWQDQALSGNDASPKVVADAARDSALTYADPDDIVVDAKDSLTLAQRQALSAKHGLNLRLNSIHSDAEEVLVSSVPPDRQKSVLEALRKDPLVEYAEPVHYVEGLWKPNDPRFKEQWNLKLVDAEEAWERKATGKGVVVAVIDTGVAAENDERCYRAKDFPNTSFTKGYDFVNDDDHPFDDNGHGTHVAGTIAETTNNAEGVAGLAYEATIMPLKVLEKWGSGTTVDIADAIRYAADHGAQVINMSLGGPMPDSVMQSACQYAAAKGVVIVCAAGNSGGRVGYPAGFKECIAVSAVGPKGELAPYSSRGKEIAIAAPGGDTGRGDRPADGILQNTLMLGEQDTDNYYSFQGTSMASPHVAATAALIIGRGVKDATLVRQLLLRGATPKAPATKYGAGILNAAEAVKQADGTRANSLVMLFTTFLLGGGLFWVYARRQAGLSMEFPWPWMGFTIGFFGPDLLFGWIGFGSPFGIVLHSALIPLYFLWEAESKKVHRFVAALALGAAVHLVWDAARGWAPFPWVLPVHGIPWLWVNAAIGFGVALIAYRRSFSKG